MTKVWMIRVSNTTSTWRPSEFCRYIRQNACVLGFDWNSVFVAPFALPNKEVECLDHFRRRPSKKQQWQKNPQEDANMEVMTASSCSNGTLLGNLGIRKHHLHISKAYSYSSSSRVHFTAFALKSSSLGPCLNLSAANALTSRGKHSSSQCLITRALSEQAVKGRSSGVDDGIPDLDWENIGFGIRKTDKMYVMRYGKDGTVVEEGLYPFGNIEISPSAGVLNYGQGLFEGLKAYRRADGRIVLFRPEENALRMIMGAERICLSPPSVEQFLKAVKLTVLANKRWIPPPGKGSLYVRPLLMGSGAVLGLAPAPETTLLVYVSPVGDYFKEGLAPIHLQVETKYHRATPGGTGGVKTIGNYAPVLMVQRKAKTEGFSDVLYLDAIHKRYLEEVSSCNIFAVKGNRLFTPQLQGTILPGITRKSIIEVARMRGYEVEERLVSVDELLDADEVFCTGTAVGVSPVGSITYHGKRTIYKNGVPGEVSQQLYSDLTGIQMGLRDDTKDWILEVSA